MKYSVMIVDDCVEDINGIKKYIDWDKLECEVVETANNGEAGLEKALDIRPNIIISDVSMPKLSGIDMIQKLSGELPNTQFIFISCFDKSEFLKDAIDNNVSSYIFKPINLKELTNAIEKSVKKLKIKDNYLQLETKITEQVNKNIGFLFERFMTDLLYLSNYSESLADFLGISRDDKYMISVIKVDSVVDESSMQIYAFLLELRRICLSTISDHDQVLMFSDALVILFDAKSKNDDDVSLTLQEIQGTFSSEFNKSVSVFLKMDSYLISELSGEFKSLINFIEQGYYSSNGEFIFLDSNAHPAYFSPQINMLELSKSINSALLEENFDINKDFISKYLPEDAVPTSNYVKSFCFYVINTINLTLIEQNKSFSDIFGDELSVWDKLTRIRKEENIRQWIFNVIVFVKEYLKSESEDDIKYKNIAENILNYINENFASPTALEESADKLSISLNYANSIFKKYYHQTIFNYLITVRMKKAKTLIRDSNMKISDIAKLTGYSGTSYFTAAFKKHTGMTPSEYRAKMK